MSKSRNNHYVPQWYQEGFFEPGRRTLAYLDLTPPQRTIEGGRVITERALFDAPTSRAFRQLDLYSTFFGRSVNDEIERYLFGDIDAKGSKAIKAFAESDVSEWHRHFQTLFEFIDIQKTRTPKGLDWLRIQYPTLDQNDLMLEMQGIRMMHCTIWSEGVREIVSAEDADVKFIVSDHPVTIYNHAASPEAQGCEYPNDPTIASKASQTIFPLNRDFCLILTNLEYARDPLTSPLDKRTFARNYRRSMVRTDAFIRTRKLSNQEVTRINYVLKARARRFIAAGRKEWLYPEKSVSEVWSELRATFLPPKEGLWNFGGEIYAGFDDGRVHYQDEFGRTEKPREFLKKAPRTKPPRPSDLCGCGSGKTFKACCESKSLEARPTWSELSIRERNLKFYDGVVRVLGLDEETDWVTVRRNLTDEKISRVYLLFQALWPLETDLLALLPKPDGVARAIYTGSIHPKAITEFAIGATLYFDELIIEHPFLHAGTVKKEFSPVDNPLSFRQEFLKAVVFFLTVVPLVHAGLVNLVPDPGNFDVHLRDQVFNMAKSRRPEIEIREDARSKELMKDDFGRSLMSLPADILRSQLTRTSPDLGGISVDEALLGIERLRERDPLAVLQEGSIAGGKKKGQLSVMKLAPNFEMTMYLAQATGSSIVTDNPFRWQEIRKAIYRRAGERPPQLSKLADTIARSDFAFPENVMDVRALAWKGITTAYPAHMREIFRYLSALGERGRKPNFEANLNARFVKAHSLAQAAIKKARVPVTFGRVTSAFPLGGIQDNTVNRLLLMSNSESHLPNVPMAFYIERRS